jgi:hypothetical protein
MFVSRFQGIDRGLRASKQDNSEYQGYSPRYLTDNISMYIINRYKDQFAVCGFQEVRTKGVPRMSIDWNHFTPWASLAGGNRHTGHCCYCSTTNSGSRDWRLAHSEKGDMGWRFAFISGLITAPSFGSCQACQPWRLTAARPSWRSPA